MNMLAALVVAVTAMVLEGWLRRGGLCRHKIGGKGSGEGVLDGLGDGGAASGFEGGEGGVGG